MTREQAGVREILVDARGVSARQWGVRGRVRIHTLTSPEEEFRKGGE
jgi:hypothetical protein